MAIWAVSGALGAPAKQVLLLHSFGRAFEPFNSFSEAFRAQLAEQLGGGVEFHDLPLESARIEGGGSEGPLLDYLNALFAARRLDLVVTIGGPAARFGQSYRQRFFPSTPMLLAAVDQRHLQGFPLTTNDAAVVVANDLSRMLGNIIQVLPQTTNVVVVIGDSPLERFWLGETRRLFQPFTNRLNYVWWNDLSFAQMQKRAAILPPRSVILYTLLAVDAEGVLYEEERALTGLHEVANAPIFGLHDSQVGRGIVGGPVVSIDELSRNTARVAARILHDEPAGSIQTPVQVPGKCVYDWRELRRWGISEERLPTGSVIRFHERTFWGQFRWRIVGVLVFFCLQTALIIGLILNGAKRRQARTVATLIADLSSRFINVPPGEVDREIEEAQRRVCECLGLDVSALWQWSTDGANSVTMTHLYRPLGGPPIPEPMNGLEYFPWCAEQLLKGKNVPVTSMRTLPPEAARDQEAWLGLGVKSNLTFPLSAGGGRVFGALGFNTTRRERSWPDEVVKPLQVVAQIFANALARQQAEQALRESEARLSLAADASGSGLWSLRLDTGRYWLTDRTRKLLGFAADEVVTFQGFLSRVYPEDRTLIRQTVEAMVRSKKEGGVEYRILQPGGEVKWMISRGSVQCNAAGQPDYLMGATVDITERKRVEEALRASEEVNRGTFEQAAVGIAHIGTDGRWLRVNDKLCTILGYERAELMKMTFQDITHPDDLQKGLAYVRRVLSGEIKNYSMEKRYVRKDQRLTWVNLNVSLLRTATGEPRHFISVVQDITERKRVEAELRHQREELAHVARVSSMGELAASVAHELNQPLAAILSNAEAAELFLNQDPPALDELRNILADIRQDDERAGEVIRRMRALLRKKEMERHPLELNSLIEDVFRVVNADASLRQVAIKAELSPGLPLVEGDRIHLQQVLLNLILNAMEATAKEPPEKRRLIVRTSHPGDGGVEASVTDSGPGIPPENLARLFEAFFTTKRSGIGMGLSIARRIIEAHGGRIWAENHRAGGAIFRVRLPVVVSGQGGGESR